jgi:hypothetical protein
LIEIDCPLSAIVRRLHNFASSDTTFLYLKIHLEPGCSLLFTNRKTLWELKSAIPQL